MCTRSPLREVLKIESLPPRSTRPGRLIISAIPIILIPIPTREDGGRADPKAFSQIVYRFICREITPPHSNRVFLPPLIGPFPINSPTPQKCSAAQERGENTQHLLGSDDMWLQTRICNSKNHLRYLQHRLRELNRS